MEFVLVQGTWNVRFKVKPCLIQKSFGYILYQPKTIIKIDFFHSKSFLRDQWNIIDFNTAISSSFRGISPIFEIQLNIVYGLRIIKTKIKSFFYELTV